jgi:hypothetical protein
MDGGVLPYLLPLLIVAGLFAPSLRRHLTGRRQ